jgi:hypothetical protein
MIMKMIMKEKQVTKWRPGWLAALMAVGGTAVCSTPALAVDNPFSMDNRSKVKLVNLECQGPALRQNGKGVDVDAGHDSGVFYTATGGLFSQFGTWNCFADLETLDGPSVKIVFCLKNITT